MARVRVASLKEAAQDSTAYVVRVITRMAVDLAGSGIAWYSANAATRADMHETIEIRVPACPLAGTVASPICAVSNISVACVEDGRCSAAFVAKETCQSCRLLNFADKRRSLIHI